jgi:hypothetical protein
MAVRMYQLERNGKLEGETCANAVGPSHEWAKDREHCKVAELDFRDRILRYLKPDECAKIGGYSALRVVSVSVPHPARLFGSRPGLSNHALRKLTFPDGVVKPTAIRCRTSSSRGGQIFVGSQKFADLYEGPGEGYSSAGHACSGGRVPASTGVTRTNTLTKLGACSTFLNGC